MKRGLVITLFALLVGLQGFLGSTGGYAQPRANGDGERRVDPAKVRELRQKIDELKQRKLIETLQLDDETSRKFFEHYRPAQRDIEGMVRERNQALKALRERMKSGASESDVEQELKRAQELTKRIQERVGSLDQELKPVLSARQRARLMVFEHEFNKRVKEKVSKMDRGGKQFRDREEIRKHLERMKHDHPDWKERMKGERDKIRRFGKRP